MTVSRHTVFPLIALILLCCSQACRQINSFPKNTLEYSLKLAGSNRPELEKVLAHFSASPADSLKYKAAVFLLSNMEDLYHVESEWQSRFDPLFFKHLPGRDDEGINRLRDSVDGIVGMTDRVDFKRIQDLQALSSDYLIKNIEEAFESWQRAPWSASVSFDAFCNYILPYKSFNEKPEAWRQALLSRYGYLLRKAELPQTMTDICCALVDEQEWFNWSDEYGDYPMVFGFSQLMEGKTGSCTEMANLGAYSNRALGIPVAVDYVAQYGNMNGSHVWNALILSDTTFLNFEGTGSRPGDMFYNREKDFKFAKVFRRHGTWVPESFAARARSKGISDIPELLVNPRIRDVTPSYTKVANVRLTIRGKQGEPVYLCIYKWRSWTAIAGDFIENNSAFYPQMGRGLVYMAMRYDHGRYEPAGQPFLLPLHGDIIPLESNEDNRQSMVLNRKNIFKRNWEFTMANYMTGARFEAANDSSFKNPVLLYEVPAPKKVYKGSVLNSLEMKDRATYESSWASIVISTQGDYQYVRLIFDRPRIFRIGELQFFGSGLDQPLAGLPIGNVPEPQRAFDGIAGKGIKLPEDTVHAHWVGLDLGGKKQVHRIRYIPPSDVNAIQEEKTYELFYWDNRWISAGIQKCDGRPLEFHQVPSGGVYWLNCKDCDNKDERIFTYENGKQMFW